MKAALRDARVDAAVDRNAKSIRVVAYPSWKFPRLVAAKNGSPNRPARRASQSKSASRNARRRERTNATIVRNGGTPR